MIIRYGLLLIISAVALAPATSFAQDSFGNEPSWTLPTQEEVGRQLELWLKSAEIDPKLPESIREYWTNPKSAQIEPDLLSRVVKASSMADSNLVKLIESCSQASGYERLAQLSWLDEGAAGPFVTNNARLYYGRWLAQEKHYDEALTYLNGLKPEDVVDPASLLFYKAVSHHCLVQVKPSIETLSKLLERRTELPIRFQQVAGLMEKDIAGVKDDSLDHIARRMEDIRRRLDLGRATDKAIEVEEGVIESLDKLIEKMEEEEKKKQQQQSSGQGSQPMKDSRPATQKGPGKVQRRDVGHKVDWGNLSPKEREKAMQEVAREFPAHYRDIIEAYFKKEANKKSSGKSN